MTCEHEWVTLTQKNLAVKDKFEGNYDHAHTETAFPPQQNWEKNNNRPSAAFTGIVKSTLYEPLFMLGVK